MGSPAPGDLAPDFELVDQDGRTIRLSDLRGEPVVLHFGASWCPYCAAELPHLRSLAEEYRGQVRVLLVVVEEEGRAYRSYVERIPPTFPFLRDTEGRVAARYAPPDALPSFRRRAQVPIASNLIVDAEGRIAFYTLLDSAGFDAELRALRRELDRLLEEEDAEAAGPQVVRVEALPLDPLVERGGSLKLRIAVAPGHHIMANRPSRPELVPTALALPVLSGVTFLGVRFPPPSFTEVGVERIAIFDGVIEVEIPFRITGEARLPIRAVARMHYQACTDRHCLFPDDLTFAFTIDPPRAEGQESPAAIRN